MKFFNSNRLINSLKIFSKDKKFLRVKGVNSND